MTAINAASIEIINTSKDFLRMSLNPNNYYYYKQNLIVKDTLFTEKISTYSNLFIQCSLKITASNLPPKNEIKRWLFYHKVAAIYTVFLLANIIICQVVNQPSVKFPPALHAVVCEIRLSENIFYRLYFLEKSCD